MCNKFYEQFSIFVNKIPESACNYKNTLVKLATFQQNYKAARLW